MDPREIRPELRDIRAASSDPMRLLDPREQMRQMAGGDMRGDPRGIAVVLFFFLRGVFFVLVRLK